jgi:AmpD protein
VQHVPFLAAHGAGQSQWQGARCNDFSIGIELEGTDASAYESIQYVRLARLVAALIRVYPALSTERVVGHSDVAPGRKSDPGPAFDWPLLRALPRFETELAAREASSRCSPSRCCSFARGGAVGPRSAHRQPRAASH